MAEKVKKYMRMLEFTDSAFPVGTFSFSNGLETAADMGIVSDAASLEDYVRDVTTAVAHSDGVAAMVAHRAYLRGDYAAIREADKSIILCKMNAEARQMTRRMGRKMAELSRHIYDDRIMKQWLDDVLSESTPGCYPVAQAITFGVCGLSELELFCSHQYGVMNMILSAALRCVRVSHYDTQRILFSLSEDQQHLYDSIKGLGLEDMNIFTPQVDILASLHEKGTKRMFMN